MSRSVPHLTLTTSTCYLTPVSDTLPIFPTVSQTHTRSMVLDPYLPAMFDGRSTPSLTGYEPKSVETKVIETEAIEPEDLEPRRIELGKNLGTDPYQIQVRFMRNSFSEDVDEFGKVGAETSYLQSQMHSDYDSAESIADSDLENSKLPKMLASPLCRQNREDCETSRIPIAPGKLAAKIQDTEASAKRTQADHSRRERELDFKFISRTESMQCFHQGATNRETCSRVLF